jgi:hypothetical protein
MWVWEGYFPLTERLKWEKTANLISNVNIMIREDIMDYVISNNLHKVRLPVNKNPELRPPYVWNHLVMNNEYVTIDEKTEKKAAKKLKKQGIENPEEILKP